MEKVRQLTFFCLYLKPSLLIIVKVYIFNLLLLYMETREKSEELTNSLTNPTMNESQPSAESLSVKEVTPTVAATDEVPAATAADEAVATDELPAEERKKYPETIEEVLSLAAELSEKSADEIQREEVARLKQVFYSLRKVEDKALLDEYVAAGNAPEGFQAPESEADVKFKDLLTVIKDKKAARAAEVEAEQQRNFEAKEALITELQALSADTDNVNRSFPRFRDIQAEFKAVGEVSPQVANDQWKRYKEAEEHFYDMLKINKDLRDYDFKKNLEAKQKLIEEADALANEQDTISAFRRLQDLHSAWREIGPVAKEIREEIWAKFKDASAIINKKYQAFFEERKARENENEAAKTAICERVEALDFDSLNSFNAWNEMTRQILQAQEDWKKLGFASKKANNALFARFRATCDKFFSLKAEYYKNVKDDLAANLEKKIQLCEKAEALKDSTQWKATADKLIELQKEWKKIGAVSKKHSDAVWTRFQQACDYFFEQKKKDLSETRSIEQANLKAKRALTEELKALPEEMPKDEVVAAIKDAQARWVQIGHVPFREKDKVYEEFRSVINELYRSRDLRETRSGMARFESNIAEITDESKLNRERERLARVLEQKRADLVTYQNNLGFLSVKSASGNSMLRDIERKTQRIKDDIAELEQKIKLIDQKL